VLIYTLKTYSNRANKHRYHQVLVLIFLPLQP
jgi:hypothetical protein